MAIPALHRARYPSVQSPGYLQRRRLHRSDEGRGMERSPLRRSHAAQSSPAQSARPRPFISLQLFQILPGSNAAPRRSNSLDSDCAELFPEQVTLEGSSYRVPDRPGLGIEVNEDALKKLEFQFFEPPHLAAPRWKLYQLVIAKKFGRRIYVDIGNADGPGAEPALS